MTFVKNGKVGLSYPMLLPTPPPAQLAMAGLLPSAPMHPQCSSCSYAHVSIHDEGKQFPLTNNGYIVILLTETASQQPSLTRPHSPDESFASACAFSNLRLL